MNHSNIRLLVFATLLILIIFPQFAYCEEDWRLDNKRFQYERSITIQANELNEQRKLYLNYQEEQEMLLEIIKYYNVNYTVTYLTTVYSASFQAFRTDKNNTEQRILTFNTTRTTELFSEFMPNFILGLDYSTKVIDEIGSGNGNTFITKFNFSVFPQFFIEPLWYQHEIELKEWAIIMSTAWSSDNLYNGYVFTIDTNNNEFTIRIKFPYLQSVYTGYASNALSNLFGALSRYAEARGEYIQRIHFLYNLKTGRLLTFSNTIQINLPGKASVKYEERIHDHNYVEEKKTKSLKIILPTLVISTLTISIIGLRYGKSLRYHWCKWRNKNET